MARNLAALVALATIGLAVGDFASDPSVPYALGLMALIAVFGFLLSYLFRPQRERPARAPERREPRRPKRQEHVWAGWDAEEARAARERRRR